MDPSYVFRLGTERTDIERYAFIEEKQFVTLTDLVGPSQISMSCIELQTFWITLGTDERLIRCEEEASIRTNQILRDHPRPILHVLGILHFLCVYRPSEEDLVNRLVLRHEDALWKKWIKQEPIHCNKVHLYLKVLVIIVKQLLEVLSV